MSKKRGYPPTSGGSPTKFLHQNVGWICKHGVGPRCDIGIVPSCYNKYSQCQFFEGHMRHPELMGIKSEPTEVENDG